MSDILGYRINEMKLYLGHTTRQRDRLLHITRDLDSAVIKEGLCHLAVKLNLIGMRHRRILAAVMPDDNK